MEVAGIWNGASASKCSGSEVANARGSSPEGSRVT